MLPFNLAFRYIEVQNAMIKTNKEMQEGAKKPTEFAIRAVVIVTARTGYMCWVNRFTVAMIAACIRLASHSAV